MAQAAKKMARSEDFKTEEGTLSYAQYLFEVRKQAGYKDKFGCTLVFPLSYKPTLEKIVAEVITDQWGDKGIDRAKAGLIKSPFLSGTGKEARNKETGELHPLMGPDVFFIRVGANADRPPFVVYKDPNRQETQDVVYSGCKVKGLINAFAWISDTGDGVSFGVNGVYKIRDGERIGGSGRADPNKYFEAVAGEEPPESAKGSDGAAGLFGDE